MELKTRRFAIEIHPTETISGEWRKGESKNKCRIKVSAWEVGREQRFTNGMEITPERSLRELKNDEETYAITQCLAPLLLILLRGKY